MPSALIESVLIFGRAVRGRGVANHTRRDEIIEINNIYDLRLIGGSLNFVSTAPIYLNFNSAFYHRGEHYYWLAEFGGIPVVINRWRGCPAHIFEIFAAVHLRSAFDSDALKRLELKILLKHIDEARSSLLSNRIVWFLLWRFREGWYYKDEYFKKLKWLSGVHFSWRANQ